METITLRTLTWKSFLGFGKYKDLRIKEIYDMNHTSYLRYVYYNVNGISFIPEILESIYVISEKADRRIKKPGTDPELGKTIDRLMFGNVAYKQGVPIAMNRAKIGAKITHKTTIIKEKVTFSKGNLQRMNQGHKYKH